MYKILYNYNTGDSFSQVSGLEGELELEWNDLEVVKANLKRIKEHYEQYLKLNTFSYRKESDAILQENKDKDWFVNKPQIVAYKGDNAPYREAIDESSIEKYKAQGYIVIRTIEKMAAENQLKLYTDDGKPWQFWAPWCGYFESLNHVEIVSKLPEGMRYDF